MSKFKPNDVRLVLGSETDKTHGNVMLAIFREVGVQCGVTILSCDRDSGDGFEPMVASFKESLIVYVGGMDLAAPAIVGALNNNAGRLNKIIFAVPTDTAARSAIENRPMGNPIMTCGLNEISLKHSVTNSALAIARLAGMLGDQDILDRLKEWHKKFRSGKPMKENVPLLDGLIP
jgi:phosphoribosylcarboxyaminoimidazole (NCAIR) mutase